MVNAVTLIPARNRTDSLSVKLKRKLVPVLICVISVENVQPDVRQLLLWITLPDNNPSAAA